MTDLSDHPFAIFQAGESYESPTERAWLKWVKRAEKLLGHDLDGDEERDGYSLDVASDSFDSGWTVEEYVEDVKAAKLERAARGESK